MKCTECPDYRECHKKNDLRKTRHYCDKAKETHHPTNADRIRHYTDEELARWLNKTKIYIYIAGQLNAKEESLPNDYEGWLDWLRKEVKDETDI